MQEAPQATTLPISAYSAEAPPRILKLRPDSPPDTPPPTAAAIDEPIVLRAAFADRYPHVAAMLVREGVAVKPLKPEPAWRTGVIQSVRKHPSKVAPAEGKRLKGKNAREVIAELLAGDNTPDEVAAMLRQMRYPHPRGMRWTVESVIRRAGGLVDQAKVGGRRPKKPKEDHPLLAIELDSTEPASVVDVDRQVAVTKPTTLAPRRKPGKAAPDPTPEEIRDACQRILAEREGKVAA